MALTEQTRKQLEQGAEERTSAAAQCLLEQDDPAAAVGHLRWVKVARRLLAAQRPRARHPLYLPGMIGLVCLTLLLAARSVPVPSNEIRLELLVSGVRLGLGQDWDLVGGEPLPISRLWVSERLGAVRVPAVGDRADRDSSFSLESEHATLDRLELPAGAQVSLEAQKSDVALFLHNGTAEGDLSVGPGRLWLSGGDDPVPLEPPPNLSETVLFSSEPVRGAGIPFSMRIETTAEWRLPRTRITAIDFSREDPPGSNEWASTLREGKGQFLETGRGLDLREGEFLKLHDLDAQIDIVRERAALRILLQGTVDRLEAGPQGLMKDLTPNLLEWLINDKEVAMLWAALLFLWGLAWKLRSFA